jgi:hypothetical protein
MIGNADMIMTFSSSALLSLPCLGVRSKRNSLSLSPSMQFFVPQKSCAQRPELSYDDRPDIREVDSALLWNRDKKRLEQLLFTVLQAYLLLRAAK